jgi:hypothetical protein
MTSVESTNWSTVPTSGRPRSHVSRMAAVHAPLLLEDRGHTCLAEQNGLGADQAPVEWKSEARLSGDAVGVSRPVRSRRPSAGCRSALRPRPCACRCRGALRRPSVDGSLVRTCGAGPAASHGTAKDSNHRSPARNIVPMIAVLHPPRLARTTRRVEAPVRSPSRNPSTVNCLSKERLMT